MKFHAKTFVASVLAMIAAATIGLLGAQPAWAITWYPYSKCASAGDAFGEPVCVAWTGGYPNGYVRAESKSSNYVAVRLDTCSAPGTNICTNFVTVATVDLHVTNTQGKAGFTPSVHVSKYGYYRVCSKVYTYSTWQCLGTPGQVYLGD